MLPGLPLPHINVQSHVHLGLVPIDGSPPSGMGSQGEPPYRFTVNERVAQWETIATFNRSWDATPHFHIVGTPGQTPYIFENFQYNLTVSWDDIEILKLLLGNFVYLVDSRHGDDTHSHTSYIRVMAFTEMTPIERLDPNLQYNKVQIVLKDANTVAKL